MLPEEGCAGGSPVNAAQASEVFRALGDPTRLKVLELLGTGGRSTATGLAERLPITRQGISKHIVVLRQAGLVESEPQGRAVLYGVRPDVLTDAARWLDRAGAAWDARLARLRDHLAQGPGRG